MMIPLALEGQWHGWAGVAAVATGFGVFFGSVYMILVGVLGTKKAYLVEGASFFAVGIVLSLVWLFGAPGTIPGTGPRGTEPEWIPFLANTEQAQDFREHVADFPVGWDKPGKKYGGGIESTGEIETLKGQLTVSLARLAAFRGLPATEPADWQFRIAGQAAATEEEAALPAATVRFKDSGKGVVLAAFIIPATDKHPEITVFAYRNKGRVFQPAAIALGVSVVMFAAHLGLLARDEQRSREEERAEGAVVREPTTTG
jgi:hypothetical protein